jgi:hypothetical protein
MGRALLLTVVVLCALQCTFCANFDFKFTGNVSGHVDNDDWYYRNTWIDSWGIGTISSGLYFSSKSVGGTPKNFSGDAVWGAAYTITGQFPQSYLAYWSADVSYTKSTDFSTLDVNTAKGFIAHSYTTLIETDPSGNTVAISSLRHSLLPTGLQYVVSDTDTNGGLQWITLTGTDLGEPWTFSLTFLVSKVVGVVNVGDAVVSPKSLETIVSIQNWKYKDPKNQLNLVMGVATGSSSIQDGQLLVSGTGDDKVYFKLAKSAVINGNKQGVTISSFKESDISTNFNDNIKAQVQGKFQKNYDVKLVTVTFPANAADIVYDPSVGAGDVPPAATSSSSTLTASLFGIVMVVIAASLL